MGNGREERAGGGGRCEWYNRLSISEGGTGSHNDPDLTIPLAPDPKPPPPPPISPCRASARLCAHFFSSPAIHPWPLPNPRCPAGTRHSALLARSHTTRRPASELSWPPPAGASSVSPATVRKQRTANGRGAHMATHPPPDALLRPLPAVPSQSHAPPAQDPARTTREILFCSIDQIISRPTPSFPRPPFRPTSESPSARPSRTNVSRLTKGKWPHTQTVPLELAHYDRPLPTAKPAHRHRHTLLF